MRLLDEAIERAVRLSPARMGIAVMYHTVEHIPGDPRRELVPAQSLDLFEMQLRFLGDRFHTVRASELPEAIASRRRGQPIPIALTFDDDWHSHAGLAAPTLRRLGLPATFFLNGASLDSPFCFWWERLQRAFDAGAPDLAEIAGLEPDSHPTVHRLGEAIEAMRPADRDRASQRLEKIVGPDPEDAGLRREQVSALAEDGFEIGFHTRRHDRLPDLTESELAEAMVVGRDELAGVSGALTDVIAYPHGRADARVASAARAAGFTVGYTDRPDPVKAGTEPLLLGRLVPSPHSVRHLVSQLAKMLVRGLRRA